MLPRRTESVLLPTGVNPMDWSVIVAIWGASVITAHSPKTATATPASTLIDVMRMMKDAKNLPDESFDAH
jgi:hypothetical protein